MSNTKRKLTKRSVEAVSLPIDGYNALHDTELPGFHVRVYPSGKRSYFFYYRYGGHERRPKLGDHGVITVDQARSQALQIASSVASDVDPLARRKPRASTINDLFDQFREWSQDVHKPRYRELNEYLFRSVIQPELGKRRLEDIARSDIERLHGRLAGNNTKANQALTLLKLLFNKATQWEVYDGKNPAQGIKKLPEGRHEKYLTPLQYDQLHAALDHFRQNQLAPIATLDAIRMLLLTGCRRGEILALKWGEVAEAELVLEDSKTGRKRVPLTQAARDLILSQPRADKSDLVFPGVRSGQEMKNIEKVWQKVRSYAGLDSFRLHDLRHSFASAAVSNGIPLNTVGYLLGHKDAKTTQRYAHLSDLHIQDAIKTLNLAVRPEQKLS